VIGAHDPSSFSNQWTNTCLQHTCFHYHIYDISCWMCQLLWDPQSHKAFRSIGTTMSFKVCSISFCFDFLNLQPLPLTHTWSLSLYRLSFSKVLFLLIFVVWWVWQALQFWWDLPALNEMHMFYVHLLDVSDVGIPAVWRYSRHCISQLWYHF
jgi:hypothetical protein